jgi:Ca2+-binding RTX toxin-like protein
VRRTVLVAATMAVALMLGAGVAVADAISGTQGNDILRGTPRPDNIYGLNGTDRIFGVRGPDELHGGAGVDRLVGSTGRDEIYGGSGVDTLAGGPNADFLNSADGLDNDVVNCGPGDGAPDVVVRDPGDRLAGCTGEDTVRSG